MKKKVPKLIVFTMTLFVLSLLWFSQTSKSPGPPTSPPSVPCNEDIQNNLETAFIQLNFETGVDNPFRNSGYEGYIPTPDLRFGDIAKGGLASTSDYSCVVNITTPSCPNWMWSEYVTSDNTTSGGKMTIKIPPPGYDVKVSVTYTEVSEKTGGSNFNVAFGSFQDTHVVYKFEMTYAGGWETNIPQPIFLKPTHQIASICQVGCTGGSVPKKLDISDYKHINDYLIRHNLFGH